MPVSPGSPGVSLGALMGETGGVIMRKLHGWGNDFLVALDVDQPDGRCGDVDWARLAVAVCDRRRGIGADGLIHGANPTDPGADVVMALFNADGGRAEMSGNGIRCLAHAVVVAAGVWQPTVVVDSDVGRRVLTLSPPRQGTPPDAAVPGVVDVSVPMGEVTPHPDPPDDAAVGSVVGGTRHRAVKVGNPHLVVLVDDPADVDVAATGPRAEALFDRGVNIEFVAPDSLGGLALRVWERGAGITEACGTGACAAASVAHQWGLVGDRCAVHMPGGTAQVDLDGTAATLTGPSVYIGRVEVAAG